MCILSLCSRGSWCCRCSLTNEENSNTYLQWIEGKCNLQQPPANFKQWSYLRSILSWSDSSKLSRECLNLSCFPKPSFADMLCRVGDMSSFMSPTRRHCMSARESKRHDIWRHVRDSRHFGNFVIVVSAQTQKLYGSYGSFWGVEWVTSLWPVATVKGAQTLYIYIYKEDLLWVWTVWGVSIISNKH